MVALALALGAAACGDDASNAAGATGASSGATAASGVAGQAPANATKLSDLAATDFSTDPAGTPFSFHGPGNGLLLVYFGYLSCPDICPLTMVDTALGIRDLDADAARVEVAFVTVDLERDRGDNLRNYLAHFFPDGRAHGLRAADDTTLLHLAYRFGVSFKIDPHEPGTYYGVAHTGATYVVDSRGSLVWFWPFGTKAAQITATLRTLLATA